MREVDTVRINQYEATFLNIFLLASVRAQKAGPLSCLSATGPSWKKAGPLHIPLPVAM